MSIAKRGEEHEDDAREHEGLKAFGVTHSEPALELALLQLVDDLHDLGDRDGTGLVEELSTRVLRDAHEAGAIEAGDHGVARSRPLL